MKVVLINGSPHLDGNTAHALRTAAMPLTQAGIEVEMLQVGSSVIRGCMACGGCSRTQDGRCVLSDEPFKTFAQKMYEADGVLIGSPVYYAGMAGTLKCFLDRAFYQSHGAMKYKIGAGIAVDRRAGACLTYDQINHYLQFGEMYLVPTHYWAMARGLRPGDVLNDAEGLRILTALGSNMVHMLHALRADTSV